MIVPLVYNGWLLIYHTASGIEFFVVKTIIQFICYLSHGYRSHEAGLGIKDASDGFC
jgi:hypothetical protein